MSRASRTILIISGLLLSAIAVLAYLNRDSADLKRALQENREFLLKANGETAAVVSFQDILDIGSEEFTTLLSTSSSAPRGVTLQGVQLRFIYESKGIDISGSELFAVRGLDGYYSVLSAEEVSSEETVYICFAMDGEILREKSAGGWGPFLMVIRESDFAQRWCKYVEEVDAS